MCEYDPNKKYIGVGIFKLSAKHPFNHAAYLHDEAYKVWPCKSTKPIDQKFLKDCQGTVLTKFMLDEITIDELRKYLTQAKQCYRITRVWGTGRLSICRVLRWALLMRRK